MLPERIETERLLLRAPSPEDAEEIFERYAQDPDVTRYLRWPPHQSIDETRHYLKQCEANWRAETGFAWAITHRQSSRILGMIDLRNPQRRQVELGYVSAREAWGLGYMTEALRAVLEVAFASGKIDRVWARCDLENIASQRVMAKGGMSEEHRETRFEVHPNLGAEPRECVTYSIEKKNEPEGGARS